MYKKVAIVGNGPRGLAALERIAVMQRANPCKLEVVVIDDFELGAGRIWRTDQDPGFLMNTVPGQITMYSGEPDDLPWRPGAGPSLYQWLQQSGNPEWTALGPNDYAPRFAYGLYLKSVYSIVTESLKNTAVVQAIKGRVTGIRKDGEHFVLRFEDGTSVSDLTSVVLATGHPKAKVAEWEQEYIRFAQDRGCTFIRGDSAADLPLNKVKPGSSVGVIGMGLGFYDIISAFTEGRGGIFTREAFGLTYKPSGNEPIIVAGSRSGLPQPARGKNQKPFGSTYTPIFFNHASIVSLRAQAHSKTGSPALDFNKDVFPLIQAEMEHVYYAAHVRQRAGEVLAEQFMQAHASTRNPSKPIPQALLEQFGLSSIRPLDTRELARPFNRMTFSSHEAFTWEVTCALRLDLGEALRGNIDSPLKAALDVLRDVRDIVRSTVEYGGLTADSMQRDFLGDFAPICSLLAAGPPAFRIEQLLALMKAGIVKIAGPDTRFECDLESGCFAIRSPAISGSSWLVETLVDSRIPTTGLAGTESPLFRSLEEQRLARAYQGSLDDPFNEPWDGGVDVTRSPFQVIGSHGKAIPGLYAIGILTERPRWFTQVGSGTPGTISRFTLDAQGVVDSIFSDNAHSEEAVPPAEEVL